MSENLLIVREGRLVRLTLNRPEKRNALDMALSRRLLEAIEKANNDPSVGAILLDARGEDYCSGMDLDEVLETNPAALLSLHRDFFTFGTRLWKPMVAQVHGSALAGGLGLALNAHIVLAASGARFGLTEARIGLWPYVIFHSVAAAIGTRKSTELALSGRILNADEAYRIGIVSRIVEGERLSEEAHGVALGLAEASADAIQDGLRFVQATLGMAPDEVEDVAVEFRKRTLDSADFREGVLAFRQKRPPIWPSHRR